MNKLYNFCLRWLTFQNHKDIGTIFFNFWAISGVIGVAIVSLTKYELANPETSTIIENYHLYTLVGFLTIFSILLPIFIVVFGFGSAPLIWIDLYSPYASSSLFFRIWLFLFFFNFILLVLLCIYLTGLYFPSMVGQIVKLEGKWYSVDVLNQAIYLLVKLNEFGASNIEYLQQIQHLELTPELVSEWPEEIKNWMHIHAQLNLETSLYFEKHNLTLSLIYEYIEKGGPYL